MSSDDSHKVLPLIRQYDEDDTKSRFLYSNNFLQTQCLISCKHYQVKQKYQANQADTFLEYIHLKY